MSEAKTYAPQLPRVRRAVSDVRRHDARVPKVALVLGSGLGGFADSLGAKTVVPYAEIDEMPRSAVPGHAGNLVIGEVRGMPVVAMQGRVHLYEGYAPQDVVFGVRLMRHLGAEILVITNAAGGCREGLAPGDLMLIEDQINLTGQSCLIGPNEDEFGVRFPDMSEAYDRRLRELATQVAESQGLELAHGVYAGVLGPSYETPAEIRMLCRLGADAIGMSTVLEVIAAKHLGMRVLGLSCITNLAAGLSTNPLSHEEVTETAARVRQRFEALLAGILERLAEEVV
jgi:purine-nucleoside phosphorylase